MSTTDDQTNSDTKEDSPEISDVTCTLCRCLDCDNYEGFTITSCSCKLCLDYLSKANVALISPNVSKELISELLVKLSLFETKSSRCHSKYSICCGFKPKPYKFNPDDSRSDDSKSDESAF